MKSPSIRYHSVNVTPETLAVFKTCQQRQDHDEIGRAPSLIMTLHRAALAYLDTLPLTEKENAELDDSSPISENSESTIAHKPLSSGGLTYHPLENVRHDDLAGDVQAGEVLTPGVEQPAPLGNGEHVDPLSGSDDVP